MAVNLSKKYWVLLFLSYTFFPAFSQCLSPFDPFGEDTLCLGSSVNFTSPPNTHSIEWDFCPGELTGPMVFQTEHSLADPLVYPRSVSLVSDSVNWYAFVYDTRLKDLYRMDIGPDLENPQYSLTKITYSTPVSNINSSTWSVIKFFHENGQWYGLCPTEGNALARLEFGSSLSNDTISHTAFIGPQYSLSGPWGLEVINKNDSILALVVNRVNSTVGILYFGNSITNTPTFLSSFNTTPLAYPNSLSIVEECGNYYGLMTSLEDNKAAVLDFQGSIFNPPTIAQITIPDINFIVPAKSFLFHENGKWVGFIKTRNNNVKLSRLIWNGPLTSVPDTIEQYNVVNGGLNGFAMDLIRVGSSFKGVGFNYTALNEYYSIEFQGTCSATPKFSLSAQPSVMFDDTGFFYIVGQGLDSNGNSFTLKDSIFVHPVPAISFSHGDTCFGDSTFFSASVIGQYEDILWDFGDGNQGPGEYTKHQYQAPGIYNVKVYVNNDFGCFDSSTSNITVHQLPLALFSPDTACRGQQIVLNDTSTDPNFPIISKQWVFGMDTLVDPTPNYAYTDTGSHVITLTVESSVGCFDTETANVYIKPGPIADFIIDSTCFQQPTVFQGEDTSGLASAYEWHFGDGQTYLGNSPVHTYADTGVYTVYLIASSANGCTDSTAQNLRISLKPEVFLTVIPGPYCIGEEVGIFPTYAIFNDTAIEEHLFIGADSFTSPFPSIFPLYQAGDFEAKYSIRVGHNCTNDTSFNISVLANPEANFIFDGYCATVPSQFVDSSSYPPEQQPMFSIWQFSNQETDTAFHAYYVFNDPGIYSVTHTVISDSGCIGQSTDSIRIVSNPEVNVYSNSNFCSNLFMPIEFDLAASDFDSVTSLHWQLFNDSGLLSATNNINPHFLVPGPGGYTVVLDVGTTLGCNAFDTLKQDVLPSPDVDFHYDTACVGNPVKFYDNYAGTNYVRYWDFGNGQFSTSDSPITFYTTPADYVASLKLTDLTTGCYDTLSKKVYVENIEKFSIGPDTVCQFEHVKLEVRPENEGKAPDLLKWSVNGQTFNDETPPVPTSSAEPVNITLEAWDRYGCYTFLEDQIIVNPSPKLGLNINGSVGTPPFPFQASTDPSSSLKYWLLNGDTLSTGHSISYTFTEPGSPSIKIGAINEAGCVIDSVLNLNIADFVADLALVDAKWEVEGSYYIISASILNLGEVPTQRFILDAYTDDFVRVQEEFDVADERGFYEVTFNTKLLVSETNFQCIELVESFPVDDAISENNLFCIGETENLQVTGPYPNPAVDKVTLHLTSPKNLTAQIQIRNQLHVLHDHSLSLERGYSSLELDIHHVPTGVYWILIFTEENLKHSLPLIVVK